MKIEYYEKLFLGLTIVVQLVFLVAIFYGLTIHQIDVAGPAGRIDPEALANTDPAERPPPFNALGIQPAADGTVQINVITRAWSFDVGLNEERQPIREIRVPAGQRVRFVLSTPDLIHGFRVLGTNLNVMVIPGLISAVEHTFNEPGEYLVICHEYCGLGHQGMYSTLIVEDGAAAASKQGLAAALPVEAGEKETGR